MLPLPLQDWSKATPYDQPAVNTLQRRKDRVEHLRDAEMGSASMVYPGISVEETPRPRMSPATIAAKVGPATAAKGQGVGSSAGVEQTQALRCDETENWQQWMLGLSPAPWKFTLQLSLFAFY